MKLVPKSKNRPSSAKLRAELSPKFHGFTRPVFKLRPIIWGGTPLGGYTLVVRVEIRPSGHGPSMRGLKFSPEARRIPKWRAIC
jgi:hypothetical protein